MTRISDAELDALHQEIHECVKYHTGDDFRWRKFGPYLGATIALSLLDIAITLRAIKRSQAGITKGQ